MINNHFFDRPNRGVHRRLSAMPIRRSRRRINEDAVLTVVAGTRQVDEADIDYTLGLFKALVNDLYYYGSVAMPVQNILIDLANVTHKLINSECEDCECEQEVGIDCEDEQTSRPTPTKNYTRKRC